jgi:hypothetical protein
MAADTPHREMIELEARQHIARMSGDVAWAVFNLLLTELGEMTDFPRLEIRKVVRFGDEPDPEKAEPEDVGDVLWCPRCDCETQVLDRDEDYRDNPTELERDETGFYLTADYSNTTSNWDGLVYLCEVGGHPVLLPEGIEIVS